MLKKVGAISQELTELRKELPGMDRMKIGFDNSALHWAKILITAKEPVEKLAPCMEARAFNSSRIADTTFGKIEQERTSPEGFTKTNLIVIGFRYSLWYFIDPHHLLLEM